MAKMKKDRDMNARFFVYGTVLCMHLGNRKNGMENGHLICAEKLCHGFVCLCVSNETVK